MKNFATYELNCYILIVGGVIHDTNMTIPWHKYDNSMTQSWQNFYTNVTEKPKNALYILYVGWRKTSDLKNQNFLADKI